MKPKTVVILLIVLAIAVAILFAPLFMTPGGGPRYDTSADVPLLPQAFLTSELNRISLPTEAGPLEFERINGQWWVTRPHLFPARTQKINELIQRVGKITATPPGETVAEVLPKTPSPLLIANERETYMLRPLRRMGAGRTQVELGIDDTIAVYNANDALHALLDDAFAGAYFDSSPQALLLPELSKIEITSDGKTSVLEQAEDRWWIGEPSRREPALEQGLPDAAGVATYLELHNAMRLMEMHPYLTSGGGLAGFGLERPLIRVVFVMQDGRAWLLQVGVPADPQDKTRYISYGPSDSAYPAVFSVDTQTALAFGQDATLFRDPRVLATPTSLIESITITRPEGLMQTITLQPGASPTISRDGVDPSELVLERVATGLKQLADARAVAYVPTAFDGGQVICSVRVVARLGGKPEDLTIYADPQSMTDNPTVLVRRGEEPVALRVASRSVAVLLDPLSLVAQDQE